jgi:phage baseplate assembly protein W
MTTPYWNYPYRIDGSGHTARADEDTHIRQMIYQVLFTAPGERVNRPDFGCGLTRMVFMPNGSPLATATQFLVHSALTRWLDGVIRVQAVDVTSQDSSIVVRVVYSRLGSGHTTMAQFSSSGVAR